MQGAFLAKYGVAKTLQFVLYTVDGKTLEPAATIVAGDVQIVIDGAAITPTTNLPTNEGGGIYSLVLTAAETTGERITVILDDVTATETFLGTALHVVTVGNASAQMEFDLDAASIPVTDAAAITGSVVDSAGTVTTAHTDLDTGAHTLTTNNIVVGRGIRWLTGALIGTISPIEAYNGSTGVATFSEGPVAPGNTDTFELV